MVRGTVAVLGVGVLIVLAAAQVAAVSPPPAALSPQIAGVDADEIHVEAAISPDGSATWTVEYRFRLSDENASSGFQNLTDRIANDSEPVLTEFMTTTRGMAATAANATGRSMVVENGSVETDQTDFPEATGIVTFEARWYGFAATSGNVEVGDAIDSMVLPDGTRLTVTWPERMELQSVTPEPDQSGEFSVTWTGPSGFASGEPRITLGGDGPFGPAPFGAGSDDVLLAGLLLAVPFALVGTVILGRRSSWGESTAEATSDGPAGSSGGEDGPPSDLLSNEEQVLALLDDNGGRVKQQDVVSELGWSETKTSEVVADLKAADELEVYRLGRENVLALPGESGFDVSPADEGPNGGGDGGRGPDDSEGPR